MEHEFPANIDALSIFEADEAQHLWVAEAYLQENPTACLTEELRELFKIEQLAETDWVSASQAALAPISADTFFVHGAHDRAIRPCGGHSVEIDAGMAFGTGHHGTTCGCLLALSSILRREHPKRVLDVGCGSGVLAIAAAKALGQKVYASDIDAVAVGVARQNEIKKEKGPHVRTLIASGVEHLRIRANGPYDLILANILAGPLVRLSTSICRQTAPGGNIILSGLLHRQEARVLSAYRLAGLSLKQRWQLDGWSTLLLSRRG
ncbi:MAG: 50S ribosomal protein L11 methyltransferase [Hyphomicrobiales bacterium]